MFMCILVIGVYLGVELLGPQGCTFSSLSGIAKLLLTAYEGLVGI